jgi:hypothetical protein
VGGGIQLGQDFAKDGEAFVVRHEPKPGAQKSSAHEGVIEERRTGGEPEGESIFAHARDVKPRAFDGRGHEREGLATRRNVLFDSERRARVAALIQNALKGVVKPLHGARQVECEDQLGTWARDAGALRDGVIQVRDIVESIVGYDEVDGPIGQWQCFGNGLVQLHVRQAPCLAFESCARQGCGAWIHAMSVAFTTQALGQLHEWKTAAASYVEQRHPRVQADRVQQGEPERGGPKRKVVVNPG